MPLSSGHGKWPLEYGVGVQEDRVYQKCAICTQKNCFSCEHLTPVRNSIFQQEPYLWPKEDWSLADRRGTVAHFKRMNQIPEEDLMPMNSRSMYGSRRMPSYDEAMETNNYGSNSRRMRMKQSDDPNLQFGRYGGTPPHGRYPGDTPYLYEPKYYSQGGQMMMASEPPPSNPTTRRQSQFQQAPRGSTSRNSQSNQAGTKRNFSSMNTRSSQSLQGGATTGGEPSTSRAKNQRSNPTGVKTTTRQSYSQANQNKPIQQQQQQGQQGQKKGTCTVL